MFCDKYNVNPLNILQGNHAQLTKSAIAQMKDVVMTNKDKIVGHAQLKDTISASGLRKTIQQINSGKYGQTALFGTEETAEALIGKVSQKIHSSGISSETTSRIANKALGKMPTMGEIGAAAKCGGMYSAAIGAGIEAFSSIGEVIDGEKDFGDALIDVGGAACKGGIIGAASSAAGTAAAGLAGAALGTAAVAPVAIGVGVACAVGGIISSFFED